jgi:protoporphyrinogen oxidase
VFRFPKEGGTGAIWTKVAALLPKEKQQYDTTVTGIDAAAKTVTLQDGSKIQYNKVGWFGWLIACTFCFGCSCFGVPFR